MRLTYVLCVVGALVGALGGCATPSVHPIYLETDKPLAEPGLVGTWKARDGTPTYTLTRAGDGYHMLVKSNEAKKPEQWEFSVRLIQLGESKFADFAAVEEERQAHDDHWGPLFVPTHMFARYAIEGEVVNVWLPKREWLEKSLADKTVTLAHTKLDQHTILITAGTAELQVFLRKYGADAGAFADKVELERVKP